MVVKSSNVKDCILMVEKIKVGATTIKFSSWSTRVSASNKDCWSVGSRWVGLMGLPLHLWSFKRFQSLCLSFGKVKEVKESMDYRNGAPVVHVRVADCDIIKIPTVVSLVHNGVKYPIKVAPDLSGMK